MRVCDIQGCPRSHVARGYCITHYNQLCMDPALRHKTTPLPCSHCGAVVEKARSNRYATRYCSYACRTAGLRATGHWPPEPKPRRLSRRQRAERKLAKAAVGTAAKRRWCAGLCQHCGEPFIFNQPLNRTCSRRCMLRVHRGRRRARELGAERDGYSRIAVFRRDKWACHICGEQIDRKALVPEPLAPTIDHIVPLAGGGSDTLVNVAAAHFICNSRKGSTKPG